MQLPAHGSNIKYVYQSMNLDQPEEIIDFSVNLNPLGSPKLLAEKWEEWFSVINDYPDPQTQSLIQTIASKEHIPSESILPGNGAAELITLIARYLAGEKVVIVHPAFSEYETACKNENCDIVHVMLEAPDWQLDIEKLNRELEDTAAVFLCNPNNPTGVHYDKEAVMALITACEKSKTLCIIDEAFYDFLDEPVSFIRETLIFDQLLILRSLTKMYNIAGLRLGFLAGNPSLLEEIGKTQPHWSVNALAMKAGVACLKDTTHVAATQQFIHAEREVIFQKLQDLGFKYSPSQINFYLLKDPALSNQKELFTYLLKYGIVLRHTENFPGIKGGWLRVAIKTTAENQMLMEALTSWKKVN